MDIDEDLPDRCVFHRGVCQSGIFEAEVMKGKTRSRAYGQGSIAKRSLNVNERLAFCFGGDSVEQDEAVVRVSYHRRSYRNCHVVGVVGVYRDGSIVGQYRLVQVRIRMR